VLNWTSKVSTFFRLYISEHFTQGSKRVVSVFSHLNILGVRTIIFILNPTRKQAEQTFVQCFHRFDVVRLVNPRSQAESATVASPPSTTKYTHARLLRIPQIGDRRGGVFCLDVWFFAKIFRFAMSQFPVSIPSAGTGVVEPVRG
jgi:hypothetical protein